MCRKLVVMGCVVLAGIIVSAAPPANKREPDPEPPPARYHYYHLLLKLPERSPDYIGKMLAPLDVAHARCTMPEIFFRSFWANKKDKMPKHLHYGIYVRSARSWEVIEAKRRAKVTLGELRDSVSSARWCGVVWRQHRGNPLHQQPPLHFIRHHFANCHDKRASKGQHFKA
jgi:hypothetical protein